MVLIQESLTRGFSRIEADLRVDANDPFDAFLATDENELKRGATVLCFHSRPVQVAPVVLGGLGSSTVFYCTVVLVLDGAPLRCGATLTNVQKWIRGRDYRQTAVWHSREPRSLP